MLSIFDILLLSIFYKHHLKRIQQSVDLGFLLESSNALFLLPATQLGLELVPLLIFPGSPIVFPALFDDEESSLNNDGPHDEEGSHD